MDAGAVVAPEYREEPVNGSPYEGVDGAEGVGDWAATYLDPPVKGSTYCEGALTGVEPAELRYLDAPNNMYLFVDVYGLECCVCLPVYGSTYSSPPVPMLTPAVFFSINLTTSSMYVNGRSLLCKNR